MHTDARTLDDQSVIEGELCIIGAGAAGISMALDWQNAGHRVILLEGGGFNVESDIQDLYAGENVGQKYYPLQSARLHFFGGTTGHWGGWCSPYDPQDFEKRDWVPHSGWPISLDDLSSYYVEAGKIVELQEETFETAAFIDEANDLKALPFENSPVWTKMWQLSPPTRFGKKYRDVIVASDDIHLYTYANVCDIRANETVSNIESVEIRMFDGKTISVKANAFVLACGAMQNARLLLASNNQAPAGLGNDNDLVGRFFMEHLEVGAGKLVLSQTLPMDFYLANIFVSKFFGELALSAEKQAELGILNCTTSFREGSFSEFSPLSIDHFPEDASKTIELMDGWEAASKLNQDESAPARRPRVFSLHTRSEQAPNPDSKITLSNQRDALGVPRTKLDWRPTVFDKHSIRSFYQTVATEAGRLGIGRIQLEDWLLTDDPLWPSYLGGGWHHMGTARMHTDPKQGVVDANCKVHGINNLYVAGSAAFTTAGAANPTLTLIALTLRLSEHLKTRL